MSTMRVAAAVLVAFASCAPQPVDRVSIDGGLTLTGGTGGTNRTVDGATVEGGAGGGQDGAGGAGGSAPLDARQLDGPVDGRPPADVPISDRAPDRPPPPPDAPPDTPPPDLPPAIPDTAPDTPPPPKVAQLVVGAPDDLLPGDSAVRALLAARLPGYTIRVRDDDAAVDLANTQLIVIAGSVESGTVGNRYRAVAVPVIILEYSLFDNMGMTGTTEDTDFGVVSGTQLQIDDPAHPLAANLTGIVAVVTGTANVSWGNPNMAAARVATIVGVPGRAAIFAFTRGAQMAALMAPAKRIGFFALETAAAKLSDSGFNLLVAAVDWALLPD